MRLIWDEVFFKLRLCFDGLVRKKMFFSESSQIIDTDIDVVVEVLEVQISVAFELCINEEFI